MLGPVLVTLMMLPLGRVIRKHSFINFHRYADDAQLYVSVTPDETNQLKDITTWITCHLIKLVQKFNPKCRTRSRHVHRVTHGHGGRTGSGTASSQTLFRVTHGPDCCCGGQITEDVETPQRSHSRRSWLQ